MAFVSEDDIPFQVIEQDSSRLVLQYPKSIFVFRLLGAILLVGGILSALLPMAGIILGGKTQFTCDRPRLTSTRCQAVWFLGSVPISLHSIEVESSARLNATAAVQQASSGLYKIQVKMPSDSIRRTTSVGLWHDSAESNSNNVFGSIEIWPGLWDDSAEAQAIAGEIQRFLVNPAQSSLTLTAPPIPWTRELKNPIGWDFLPFILLIGAVMALLQQGRCEFNRSTEELDVKYFGPRTKAEKFSLKVVEFVAIEEFNSAGHIAYRVVLVTRMGDRYPLDHFFSPGLASKKAIAETIREFLDLPPVQVLPNQSKILLKS